MQFNSYIPVSHSLMLTRETLPPLFLPPPMLRIETSSRSRSIFSPSPPAYSLFSPPPNRPLAPLSQSTEPPPPYSQSG